VSAREFGGRLGAGGRGPGQSETGGSGGTAWPLADDVTDGALKLRLFGRTGVETGQRRRTEPDCAALARELKRPGVTMMILWEEYREVNRKGYGYRAHSTDADPAASRPARRCRSLRMRVAGRSAST
jgi:transposase